jgi:hypothetical protein
VDFRKPAADSDRHEDGHSHRFEGADQAHDRVLLGENFLTHREQRHADVPRKKRRVPRAADATTNEEINVIDLPRGSTTGDRTPAESQGRRL